MYSEVTVHYSEALVRSAVGRYLRRFIRWRFWLALAFVACMLAYSLWQGDRSWAVGFMGAVVALGLIVPIAAYVAHYRRGLRALRGLSGGEATVVVSDASLRLSSAAGSMEIAWSGVKGIWRYPDLWLLVFGNSYATLPIGDFPEPVLAFLTERVTAAGGKVR